MYLTGDKPYAKDFCQSANASPISKLRPDKYESIYCSEKDKKLKENLEWSLSKSRRQQSHKYSQKRINQTTIDNDSLTRSPLVKFLDQTPRSNCSKSSASLSSCKGTPKPHSKSKSLSCQNLKNLATNCNNNTNNNSNSSYNNTNHNFNMNEDEFDTINFDCLRGPINLDNVHVPCQISNNITQQLANKQKTSRQQYQQQKHQNQQQYQPVNKPVIITRTTSKNRKNQSSLDLSHPAAYTNIEILPISNQRKERIQKSRESRVFQDLNSIEIIEPQNINLQNKNQKDGKGKCSKLSQFLTQNCNQRNQRINNENLDAFGMRQINTEDNMLNVLQYSISNVQPTFEYKEQQQSIKQNGLKFDINKNLYPSLTGQKLTKEQAYQNVFNIYSGLVQDKLIDACFQDLLTKDPFQVVHEKRNAHKARYKFETSKQAQSRSLVASPNTIKHEPRRVTLVHQSKFEELEVRKAKAASAWLGQMNQTYEHQYDLEYKKQMWEIERKEAMRAKQDNQYRLMRDQRHQQRLIENIIQNPATQTSLDRRNNSSFNNQNLSDRYYSAPNSPSIIKMNRAPLAAKDNNIDKMSNLSGAPTNCTSPKGLQSYASFAMRRNSTKNSSRMYSGAQPGQISALNQHIKENSYGLTQQHSRSNSRSQNVLVAKKNSFLNVNVNLIKNQYVKPDGSLHSRRKTFCL
ncbi:UNKNOWN [Stylonychia lemnae]|uniref:Uncharacterized protein n=1 Tax=Stylonychia lemnae TaxID=5949 RepID=A0A077ZX37_STYLE|nr:UNKNOWN [Stylonychia lemnae]|eukprot:CDW74141.1 UNKNOWN [Stylonychia lemnae]